MAETLRHITLNEAAAFKRRRREIRRPPPPYDKVGATMTSLGEPRHKSSASLTTTAASTRSGLRGTATLPPQYSAWA